MRTDPPVTRPAETSASDSYEEESDEEAKKLLRALKKRRIQQKNGRDDESSYSGSESDDSSMSEIAVPKETVTRSGRKTKTVQRMAPTEDLDLADYTDDDDDDGGGCDGDMKTSIPRKNKKKKAFVKFENLTDGFCEQDQSFVIYFRPTGHVHDQNGKVKSVIGSATFEVTVYPDVAFLVAAGKTPKQERSDHYCAPVPYTRGLDAERRKKLRADVQAGEIDPKYKTRAPLICELVGRTEAETQRLAQLVSPFCVLPFRVKLSVDLLGVDQPGKFSVAPHYEYPKRLRKDYKYGFSLGVYEMNRFSARGSKKRAQPAKDCLAGLPLMQNAAFVFEYVDREPVFYYSSSPSVAEVAALRPMFVQTAPVRANVRSWSPAVLYNHAADRKLSQRDVERTLGELSTCGALDKDAELSARTAVKSMPAYIACTEWAKSRDGRRALFGSKKPERTIRNWKVGKTLTVDTVQKSKAIKLRDAAGCVTGLETAVGMRHPESGSVVALTAPFASGAFYTVERFVGFELAMLLSCQGRIAGLSRRIEAGFFHDLLCEPAVLRVARLLPDSFDQRLYERLAVHQVLHKHVEACFTPTMHSQRTGLAWHRKRLQLLDPSGPPDDEDRVELARKTEQFRVLWQTAMRLAKHQRVSLSAAETASLPESLMWPKDKDALLAVVPDPVVRGASFVGWTNTTVPALALSGILDSLSGAGDASSTNNRLVLRGDTYVKAIELCAEELLRRAADWTEATRPKLVLILYAKESDKDEIKQTIKRYDIKKSCGVTVKVASVQTFVEKGLKSGAPGSRWQLLFPRADSLQPEQLASFLAAAYVKEEATKLQKRLAKDDDTLAALSDRRCHLRIAELALEGKQSDLAQQTATGAVRLAPILGTVLLSGEPVLDNLAIGCSYSHSEREFELTSLEQLRRHVSFVEKRSEAEVTVYEAYNGKEPALVVDVSRGTSLAVHQKNLLGQPRWMRGADLSLWTNLPLSNKVVLLLDHASNPLWKPNEAVETPLASTDREWRQLQLAGLLRARVHERVVIGECEATFGPLIGPNLKETLGADQSPAGFILFEQ